MHGSAWLHRQNACALNDCKILLPLRTHRAPAPDTSQEGLGTVHLQATALVGCLLPKRTPAAHAPIPVSSAYKVSSTHKNGF